MVMAVVVMLSASASAMVNHPNDRVIEYILEHADTTFPLRFVVFGDPNNDNAHFPLLMRRIAALDPQPVFAICVGDVAAGGTSIGYANYIARIDSSDIPILTVIGNHEVNDSLGFERFQEYFGYPDYHFDFMGIRFLMLMDTYHSDTLDAYGENMRYMVTEEQVGWVDSALADFWGIKFVFLHAPPRLEGHNTIAGCLGGYGYNPPRSESHTDELTDVFRERGVRAVFAGHIHVYDRWQENGSLYGNTIYLITGGGGATLTPWPFSDPYGGSLYHFLLIEVSRDSSLSGYLYPIDESDTTGVPEPAPTYTFSYPYVRISEQSSSLFSDRVITATAISGAIDIRLPIPLGKGNYEIRLYDINGREFMDRTTQLTDGNRRLHLPLKKRLPNGVYLMRIDGNGYKISSKVIVVR